MERKWEDVGAEWDALVGGKGNRSSSALDSDEDEDEEDEGGGAEGGKEAKRVRIAGDDGIEWAKDGEGKEFGLFAGRMSKGVASTPPTPLEELGPLNELPDYAEKLGMAGMASQVSGSGSVAGVTDDRVSERTMLAPRIHRSRVNGNGALQFQLAKPQRDSLVRDGEDDVAVVQPLNEGDAAAAEVGGQSDTSSETSESTMPVGVGIGMATHLGPGIIEGDEPPERKVTPSAVDDDEDGRVTTDIEEDSAIGLGPVAEAVVTRDAVVMKSEPIAVVGHMRNSRSLTGSSDGSPVEKLGAAWGATFSRGRLRTRVPIVEAPVEPDW